MNLLVQPVVMVGGSDTRLWPLSRAAHPKPFLVLSGHTSSFQQAVARIHGLATSGQTLLAPLIVGNEDHGFLVLDQMREARTEPAAVLLEPMSRNTAPALMLAALQALDAARATHGDNADPVLVVTAADQTITDQTAFTAAVQRAVVQAADGAVVILGIRPDRPETGYGYIRAQGAAPSQTVAQFVEKPDLATAQRYLAAGSYYWNASIFVLRASVWIAALERFRPDMVAACQRAWAAKTSDAQFVRPGKHEFAAVPAESIDCAVMEKCPGVLDIRMQELDAGWNDLGAWEAVWQVAPKDAAGNVAVGDAIVNDSYNTLVHATSRLVTVVGMDDVVVVETADAVLVASRKKSQDVKQIVSQIGAERRGEQALHRKVQRPWGWYDGIDQGPRHQVKRIMVKPGASLSLQMHHHRAEHWIVVSGTAEVTNGDKVIMLTENQSTYIPLGQTHRLHNPGRVPLEIIEVQSGGYLGEDDIVRFEDTYGRVTT
ncbi:mannose-1-phosphate guanylyltransferase/mannose-6-phosphate isomerase [Hydrogenophaga sp.]|uniref:mannose-1-phosphate guanylyltransferase/mannose-6-phosphate isomerase n=1 Tax=Hydrogenophaga sp. TaxID=1904254 RepID=UPI00260768A9|nr:mannose-1-phosphate guanylyltransferase/mannose-6-phosphate isomerase [Hydrogenophaga sp.]MDM7948409.1 mannose-1-phosphate guanylyltransferase/mannose-6-phosphate isomerase [Hydrogenophaga sp.]